MFSRGQALERAREAQRESKSLDFKSEFDPGSTAHWCELVKDIVAFANSGGGVIVIGANDDGSRSSFDIAPILLLDPADVTNQLSRYTGTQFADFEFVEIERSSRQFAALVVFPSDVPLIFQRPGTYPVGPDRQKTAFSQGTVYFRHGAKSEPGNRDDLIKWRDVELERRRSEWLKGIRKVVEAPAGSRVQVVGPSQIADGDTMARITTDPNAPSVRLQDPATVYPLRQQDVIRLVNERLGLRAISAHDIQCIKRHHRIVPASQPEMVFKPHPTSSPQYSPRFVEWIVQQINRDSAFLVEARRHYNDH